MIRRTALLLLVMAALLLWVLWPRMDIERMAPEGGANSVIEKSLAGANSEGSALSMIRTEALAGQVVTPDSPSDAGAAALAEALQVLVLDLRGVGAPGAEVYSWTVNGGWRRLGQTDEGGLLSVAWADRGMWLDAVGVRMRGGAEATNLRPGANLVIQMRALEVIRGRAIAPDGRGLSGVMVLGEESAHSGPSAIAILDALESANSPFQWCVTDAAGDFSLLVVPGADFELQAFDVRQGWLMREPRSARAGDADVMLPMEAVYAAQIVMHVACAGQSSFDLQPWMLKPDMSFDAGAHRLLRGDPAVERIMIGERYRSQTYCFAEELIVTSRFERQEWGPVSLIVNAMGMDGILRTLSLPRLRSVPEVVTITLDDTARGRGELAVALLQGSAEGGELLLSSEEMTAGDPFRKAIRDWEASDGTLRLDHVPAGEWRVRLSWPETGASVAETTAIVGATPARVEFDLQGLGTASLTMQEANGTPWIGPASFTLEAVDVPLPLGTRVPAQREHAPYLIAGLPPGRWAIYARRESSSRSDNPTRMEFESQAGRVTELTMRVP